MAETIVAIIPLYNGAKYIRPAIESILAQERQPDEIVVVDDGSTDNGEGAAIVSEVTDPRIKLLFKENGGQGSARNFGVQNSTSSLIAFLDQDDLWYPHHLRVLEKPFLENKSLPLGWVYSNLDQINANGNMVCQSILSTLRANEHPKRTINCCLGQDMYILPGASLISRTAYESVGGFDPQFSGYEDDDLFLRMFCKGWRNEYIDKPLTIWRAHANSSSRSRRMAISRAKYFEKLVQAFPDYVSEIIAPRFVPNALLDLYTGIKRKDPAKIDLAREHLKTFSRRAAFSRRLKVRAVALAATLPPIRWMLRLLPRSIVMGASTLARYFERDNEMKPRSSRRRHPSGWCNRPNVSCSERRGMGDGLKRDFRLLRRRREVFCIGGAALFIKKKSTKNLELSQTISRYDAEKARSEQCPIVRIAHPDLLPSRTAQTLLCVSIEQPKPLLQCAAIFR